MNALPVSSDSPLVLTFFWSLSYAQTVVDDAALSAVDQGGNWLGFGRNYSEQRFSPLKQITADNVAGLAVDWYVEFPNDRALTATPLIVDGVHVLVGSYNVVRAVERQPGKLIWEYGSQNARSGGDRLRITWDLDRGHCLLGRAKSM